MLGKKNQTLDRAGAPSAALVVILAAALISTSSAQAQTYTYKLLHTFSGAEGSRTNAVTLGAGRRTGAGLPRSAARASTVRAASSC